MGDLELYVVIQRVGFFLTGGVTTSATLVPSNVGRKEITKSGEVQEHPEHVSLNLPCLLPSQYKLVTFNLCKHIPEVSCQTQKGREGGRCKTFELPVNYNENFLCLPVLRDTRLSTRWF